MSCWPGKVWLGVGAASLQVTDSYFVSTRVARLGGVGLASVGRQVKVGSG